MSSMYESRDVYEQARRIMRSDGSPCMDTQGKVIYWSWDEDAVRQRLGETDAFRWFARCLELERRDQAGLSLYAAPVSYTEDGVEVVYDQWQDEASEDWGAIYITSAGVVRLAAVYNRSAP